MPEPEVVAFGAAMHLFVAEPGIALSRAGAYRAGIAGAETKRSDRAGPAGPPGTVARPGGSRPVRPGCASRPAKRGRGRLPGADRSRPAHRPADAVEHPSRGIEVQYARAGSAAPALDGEYVRAQDLCGVRLVHVTGITPMLSASARAATEILFDCAVAAGAAISFDINVRRKLGEPQRWREVVAPLLVRAHLVFAGRDELELICGAGEPDTLLAAGASSVVVKDTDKSSTVVTAAGCWRQGPLATTVVDPVGAGDALVSGYLDAWLRDAAPKEALLAGAASAAHAVGAASDTEGLPSAAELARAVHGTIEHMDR